MIPGDTFTQDDHGVECHGTKKPRMLHNLTKRPNTMNATCSCAIASRPYKQKMGYRSCCYMGKD